MPNIPFSRPVGHHVNPDRVGWRSPSQHIRGRFIDHLGPFGRHRLSSSHRSLHALAVVCVVTLGASVHGCPQGDAGETLDLRDASQGCEGQAALSRPYAVGARLDLSVGEPETGIGHVIVERPDLWSVEALENPISLRAIAEGKSLVTVRSEDGRTGSVMLETARIDRATVSSWPGIQPFNIASDLSLGAFDMDAYVAARGYALLPDGSLRVEATFQDMLGRELGGIDVTQWTAEPADAVRLTGVELGSDAVAVTPTDMGPGEVVLSTAGGGEFRLSVVPTGAAQTVELLAVERAEIRSALELTRGTTETFVALAFDGDGRWLVGSDGRPLSITLENDGIVTVAAPPWSEGEDAIELDTELEELLRAQGVFYLRGLSPGETTIVVELAGVSQAFAVRVASAP